MHCAPPLDLQTVSASGQIIIKNLVCGCKNEEVNCVKKREAYFIKKYLSEVFNAEKSCAEKEIAEKLDV